MYCKKCGTQIADDAEFCQKCGTKQNEAVKTSSSTTPVSQVTSAVGNALSSEMHILLRMPILIALLVVMITPFLNIYSIPIADTGIKYYIGDIGIDTSFSLFGYAKLLHFLIKQGGNPNKILIIILPVIIYFLLWGISAYKVFYAIKEYMGKNHNTFTFWSFIKTCGIVMTIDNIFLIVCNSILTKALNSIHRLPIDIEIIKISTLVYVMIGLSVIISIISDKQYKNSWESYKRNSKEARITNTPPVKQVVTGKTWICKECGDVNPSTTHICRGCGKYR